MATHHIDYKTQKQPGKETRRVEGLYPTSLIDRLPVIFFEMDSTGCLLSASESTQSILGYSFLELDCLKWREALCPGNLDEKVPEILEILNQKNTDGMEVSLANREGEVQHLMISTERVLSEDGDVLKIQGAAVDITRQKEETERWENSYLSLKNARLATEQILGIISSVQDYAIFTLDANGYITSWNTGAEKIKGYTAEEAVGKHFSMFYPEDARQAGKPAQVLQAALENGRYEEDGLRVRKGGEKFWANIVISPIYDRKGQLRGFTKVVRDITRRKKNEEELRRQYDYLHLLQEVAVAANEAQDVDNVLSLAVRRICDTTGWSIGHAFKVTEKQPVKILSARIWYLSDPYRYESFREASEKLQFHQNQSLIGKVYSSGSPTWLSNLQEEPDYSRRAVAAETGIKSGIAFPILVGKSVEGILEFYSTQEIEQDQQLMKVMSQIGTQLGRVIERKKAESNLRKSENEFRTIFEGAALGIELIDLNGNLLESNAAVSEMTGYTQNELRQLVTEDSDHPANIVSSVEFFDDLRNGKRKSFRVEKPFLRKDGRLAWGRISTTLVKGDDDTPQFAIAMLEDITERRQMENELVELQRRLMEGRESERLELAQELHDGPVQDLYGLIFQMKAFSETLPENERHQMGEFKEMITQVIITLRAISKDLRPPTLAPFGLEKAIRSHADIFIEDHPLEITLDLMPDGQLLPEKVRLALFRIYQQTLVNIARHANAKRVMVRFRIDEKNISLEIEDDGQGFEIPTRWVELARQGHLGLVGAAERAEAIGGTFKIESATGSGTVVKVNVPRSDVWKLS